MFKHLDWVGVKWATGFGLIIGPAQNHSTVVNDLNTHEYLTFEKFIPKQPGPMMRTTETE